MMNGDSELGRIDDGNHRGRQWIRAALTALVLCGFAAPAPAIEVDPDVRTWWVFFKDKGVADEAELTAALDELLHTYPPRAIARRSLRRTAEGLFDTRDLPVSESYIAAVAATGARIRARSRWLNAVSVQATRGQLAEVSALPFVVRTQPVAVGRRIAPIDVNRDGARQANPGEFYGRSREQLDQINVPAVHARGITGAGVIMGILDTGFVTTHEAFNEPGHEVQVLGQHDFIEDDENTGEEPGDPPGQYSHGTLILGTIAAYKPEDLVGPAYDAAFFLAKTEDIADERPIEEDWYVEGLEWIEANGADVATSSLSYSDWYTQEDMDGRTAVTTIAVNVATENGVACCTAAGNAGHDDDPETSHLGAPADALEVITVGAVSNEGSIVGFSSDGPTADGRVKPEVLARGARTWTIDPDDDQNYTSASGTSLSTPLVAGATALVVQAHPDWSVKQIRRALFLTANDYVENGAPDPEFVRGFGIIDVLAAIDVTFIGDVNRDGDTNAADVEPLHDCLTGPGTPPTEGCRSADVDEDDDVDVADYALLIENITDPWPW
jgi:hypothetical protein